MRERHIREDIPSLDTQKIPGLTAAEILQEDRRRVGLADDSADADGPPEAEEAKAPDTASDKVESKDGGAEADDGAGGGVKDADGEGARVEAADDVSGKRRG